VSRRPCIFKQTDLTRALKGARAAGMEIARVEIESDGRIVVVPGMPEAEPKPRTCAPRSVAPDDPHGRITYSA
jgi:hypothetical protein